MSKKASVYYNRGSKLDPLKDQILTSYDNGWTVMEIAIAHGVHHSTIVRFLDKHGVQRRGRGKEKRRPIIRNPQPV